MKKGNGKVTDIRTMQQPMNHEKMFQTFFNLIKGRMIMYEQLSEHLDNRVIIKRALVVGVNINQNTGEIRSYLCKDDFNNPVEVSKESHIGDLM